LESSFNAIYGQHRHTRQLISRRSSQRHVVWPFNSPGWSRCGWNERSG
jgi:hypothetical protein